MFKARDKLSDRQGRHEMDKVVRAFPITSRDALMRFSAGVKKFSGTEKEPFFSNFSNGVEDWFYQEIDGKPFVICVAQGDGLEQGYANYNKLDDKFSLWFKQQVAEMTNVDVNKTPKGPDSEHVFCFTKDC